MLLGCIHSESLGWHANERTSPPSLAGIHAKVRSGFERRRARALQERHSLLAPLLKRELEWLRKGMSETRRASSKGFDTSPTLRGGCHSGSYRRQRGDV